MKITLIIISGALMVGVILYSIYNRDSDRVLLTLISAMTIGSLGFITKESISNKTEKYSTEFPVAVFFGAPNYLPLNISLPYDHELRTCLQEVKEIDIPQYTDAINIEFGQKMYFYALEYIIVQEIFKRYSQGWNVLAKQRNLPSGKALSWQALNDPGEEILLKDFLNNFPKNYFVASGLHRQIPAQLGGKAVFPLGSNFSVEHKDDLYKTTIRITNKYIKLDIIFTQSSSSVGIGEYTRLLGVKGNQIDIDSQKLYGNSAYLLEINIKQTLWLNGHPEMKAHRNWADSIVELLDNKFNYEKIREEHLRQFQLYGPEAIRAL
jgi:hypothetical protein